MLMGGRAEGLVCADPGARTPIGVSGNFHLFYDKMLSFIVCRRLPKTTKRLRIRDNYGPPALGSFERKVTNQLIARGIEESEKVPSDYP